MWKVADERARKDEVLDEAVGDFFAEVAPRVRLVLASMYDAAWTQGYAARATEEVK